MPASRIHTTALVIAALLTACLKRNPGFQDEAGESGPMNATSTGEATTAPVTTDMSPETGGTTVDLTTSADTSSSTGAVVPTTGEPTSSSSTGTTGSSSTGESTTGSTGDTDPSTGEPGTPSTCAEALAQGGVVSGVYTLQVPESMGATVEVWCEQEVAGGGWLLVGRSAEGPMPPMFGWGVGTGDLMNDGEPYTLNLLALKFPANEVLLGSRGDGKQPSDHVYRLTAPPGFPFGFDLVGGVASGVETVLGDCAPDDGPAMLRSLGFTKVQDRFRLRDIVDGGAGDIHGLAAAGFTMPEDCDNGGELNGSQGLIFVR